MKRIKIMIAAIAMVMNANAQTVTQGSLRHLLGVRAMSVNFDFSKTMVEGVPMKDFIQNMYYAGGGNSMSEFERDKREIVADFVEEFNDAEAPLMLTVSQNAKVRMTVVVKEINRRGNTVKCDYVIRRNNGTQVAVIEMTSKDGRIGSFANLMGDAFETAGEDLGKFMKRTLKKERKKAVKEHADQLWTSTDDSSRQRHSCKRNYTIRTCDGTTVINISSDDVRLGALAEVMVDAMETSGKTLEKRIKRVVKKVQKQQDKKGL